MITNELKYNCCGKWKRNTLFFTAHNTSLSQHTERKLFTSNNPVASGTS